MGLRGLAMVYSAAQDQSEKSAMNLEAIRAARQKNDSEAEALAFAKKKNALDIEGARLGNTKTQAEIDHQNMLFSNWEKSQKTILAGKQAEIDQAEHAVTQQGRQAATVIKDVQSTVAQTLNPQLVGSGRNTDELSGLQPIMDAKTGTMRLGDSSRTGTQQGRIVSYAMRLAKENSPYGAKITPEMVRDYIPQAKDLLYNEGKGLKTPGTIQPDSDEMVRVISPKGEKGSIKKSKLDAALKAGYKRG